MSDHDTAPDPIDKAYAQAEAMLSDDEARAARRARVLGAVADQAKATAPPGGMRRPGLRHGRWLAAAGVAGFALLVAIQIHPVAWRPAQTIPSAATAPAAAPRAATPVPTPKRASVAPLTAPRLVVAAPSPPSPVMMPAAPEPPPVAPPPLALPPPPPPPPPPPLTEAAPAPPDVVVTAARRRSGEAMASQDTARDASEPASPSALAAFPAASASAGSKVTADLALRKATRLRAAAAAGQTAEVEALLDQGVPVDAPDADGDTALMKSIQADQPGAAGLLRRRGASLDRRNHAGRSARDMATAQDDPDLSRAIEPSP